METLQIQRKVLWKLWLSSVMSVLLISQVLVAIRLSTMKGMKLELEEPILRGIRWGAAILVLLFWLVGYFFTRRFKRSQGELIPEGLMQPSASVGLPSYNTPAILSWSFFEAGVLVSLVYWFLTTDWLSILPGLLLHTASLLFFNPSTLVGSIRKGNI